MKLLQFLRLSNRKNTKGNKNNTNKMNWFDQLLNKMRLATSVAACSALILAAPSVMANEIDHQLHTIYHVYVDGERLGSISDIQAYEDLVAEKLNEYHQQYESMDLVIGQEVELIPERVFQVRTKSAQTIETLADVLSVKAEAIAISFDDHEEVVYVEEEEEAQQVVREFKLKYVSDAELESFETRDEEQIETENIEVGKSIIKDIRLSAEAELEEELVDPDQVLSVEKAVQMLQRGALTEEQYTVSPGDVLSSIASDHDLSTKELLELNPEITEDTLLQIGQKVNVTAYQPIVTVQVEKVAKDEEEITFQTETREDDSMWRGDTKIVQEGQPGKRIVSYEIIEENGRTVQRTIVDEEVIEEAVNRVVVKGTKQSTSRGTGSLGWPAVGGYISSYQGNRWGRFHKGIDIARPSNYNILAADNGTVISAGWQGGYGNTIRINHNNGIETLYAHLESIDVSVGQTVAKGQKIGIMGTTGNSTGIHLHFEVYRNGQLQNPMDYLSR